MSRLVLGKPLPAAGERGGDRPGHVRWWLPLIVVAFAAGLRIPGLVTFPFEQDELYTVIEATALFDSPLRPGIQARPLYYLLHHPLLDILPQTHLGLRIPAFIFGIIGVWLTWIAGSRALGATAGLVAMVMVAISPWHMHASGMARYWSLVYVFAVAFYLHLLRGSVTGRPRDYLLALLYLVLGTATHPTFLFPVIGAAVGMSLVSVRPGVRRWWPPRQAVAYLWVPFGVLGLLGFGFLSLTGTQSEIRNFDGRGLLATMRLVPAMVQWMTPTVFAAGFLGAGLLLREGAIDRRQLGAMALGGSCAALILLSTASLVTDVYADYGMAMLPLLFLSTGALVQLLIGGLPGGGRILEWGAVALLGAGVLPSTVSHLSDGTRFDYRPAFQQIASTEPELPVLTWPIVLQQRYAPELRGRELEMTARFLAAQLVEEREFWVVVPVQRYGLVLDGGHEVKQWLDRNCRLTSSHQRPRLDYRLYRVDLYRCGQAPS